MRADSRNLVSIRRCPGREFARFRLLVAPVCSSAPSPEPPPTLPPAIATPDAASGGNEVSPQQILERLQKMEQTIKDLHNQNKALEEKYQSISKELEETKKKSAGGRGDLKAGEAKSYLDPLPPGTPESDAEARERTPEGGGGGTRAGDQQGVGNRKLGKIQLDTFYNYGREGFEFGTEDDELTLKFRALVQADAKFFLPSVQSPVTDGFYLNRARLYFDGHLTKPIDYQISFQESYDSFNVLNVFLNFNYDKRLQFRIGRFKTPYTYEYYKMVVWNLYAPERSLYNVNFALNRQVGAMAWGELFDNRVEYAIGAFDGARNSYQAYKNTPDAIGFVNFKPFEQAAPPSRWSFLRDFNFGGSADWGNENNPLTPAVLRTSTNASSAGITSTSTVNSANVPFLAFNNNVTEKGARALWELHMAYYYKGLTLLGAWDAGYESWAVNGSPHQPVRVPVNGYFVQAAYLITGETRTASGLIDPLRRFDLRPGRFGLGAWEPTARFSSLALGNQVFTGGLADPNLWTNQAYMIDVGVNWYLNKFVKVYFDWEHSIFGQPVYYNTGGFTKTSDLFWLRFQSFF